MIKDNKQSLTRGYVVMISGCRDLQTSADSFIQGKYQGALTNTFLYVVGKHKHLTYEDLIKKLRSKLKKGRYSQIPCLSSGRSLKLNTRFNV